MTALHSIELGDSAAPPVILLHAIGASSAMWQPQFAAWANRFRLIALDLPGHGRSPQPPHHAELADYAQAVAKTLEQLGIGNAAIVGLSFGAMVATRLAHDRIDLVSSLVIANGVAVTSEPVRAAWIDRISIVRDRGIAEIAVSTLERWFTPLFISQSPETVRAIGDLVRATSPDGFCAAARTIATLDQTRLLPSITCPSLVVTGLQDLAAPSDQVAAIADALPTARLLQLDAPHLSSVECADAFNEQVGAFLSEMVVR